MDGGVAADERPEAAGAATAAGEGGVSGGDARRVETVNEDASVVDGDGALAAPAFFPPLFFFGMTIEVGRVGWNERMSSSRGYPLHALSSKSGERGPIFEQENDRTEPFRCRQG